MRSIPLVVKLCLGLLALPGCSDRTSDSDGSGHAPVELLEGGRDPRRLMSFADGGAGTQSAELTVKLSMGIDYDGQSMPAETIPATSTTLEFLAPGRSDAGRQAYRFRIVGAAIVDYGSDMERLAQVNRELTNQDPMGRGGSLIRSVNGQVLEVEFEIPPASTSTLRHFFGNLKQALQQLCVPFPDQPIGPGARFRASLPVKISGMELTQNGSYVLQQIEGDRLTVALSARMLAEPQLFQLPNMPASSRCELIELSGEAQGELTVDRTRPFPVEVHLEYRFDMRMRMQSEGRTSLLNSHVELSFDVRTP